MGLRKTLVDKAAALFACPGGVASVAITLFLPNGTVQEIDRSPDDQHDQNDVDKSHFILRSRRAFHPDR
jgi:hypothetical protein